MNELTNLYVTLLRVVDIEANSDDWEENSLWRDASAAASIVFKRIMAH